MNKEAFLQELTKRLYGLSENDLNERLAYYGEVLDAKVENGMTEEEAVASIGSVDTVVNRIMSEIPLTKLVREKVETEKKGNAWKIVLLILLFPIWFPLLVALFAVFFSLLVAIWAIILAFYIVDLALMISAVVLIPGSVVLFFVGGPGATVLGIGAAFVCAGLSVLLFLFCGLLVKGTVKLMKLMLLGIKSVFVGKEKKTVTVEGRWSD